MSQLNFSPAARMVDTFAAPEVRLSNDGTELQQLAASLASLQPSLQRYADVATKEEQERRMQEAYAFIREREVTNMNQLKKLVEAGELDENANPWKLRLVNRLVAKREFTAVASQVEAELLQDSAVRDSDDFGFVQQEAIRRLNERMPELDVQTAAALAGEYEGFVQDYVSRHAARRVSERELVAQEAFVKELAQQLSGSPAALAAVVEGSSRPEIQALADATINGLQNTLNTLERTTSAPKVRAYAVSAIVQAAVEARNPKVAEVLLSRLTVAGESVGSIVSPGEMDEIRDKITRAELDDWRLAELREQNIRRRQVDELGTIALRQMRAGEPVRFNEENLSAEAWLEIKKVQRAIQAQLAEDLVGRAAAAYMGGSDTATDVDYDTAAVSLGYPGFQALQQIKAMNEAVNGSTWGETTPQMLVVLDDLITSGRPYLEARDRLLTLARSGAMSKSDFQQTLTRLQEAATPQGQVLQATVTNARQTFMSHALAGLLANPENLTTSYDGGPPELRAEVEQALKREAAELDTRLWRFTWANPNATAAEIDEFIATQIDQAAKNVGGYTREEFERNRSISTTLLSLQTQGVVRDFSGRLLWENGQYLVRGSDGTTAPYPGVPRLFESVDDLRNIADVKDQFGIGNDADRLVALLRSQAASLDQRRDKLLATGLLQAAARIEAAAKQQANNPTSRIGIEE